MPNNILKIEMKNMTKRNNFEKAWPCFLHRGGPRGGSLEGVQPYGYEQEEQHVGSQKRGQKAKI